MGVESSPKFNARKWEIKGGAKRLRSLELGARSSKVELAYPSTPKLVSWESEGAWKLKLGL